MYQYQQTGEFPSDEQPWESNLPHHPSQSDPPPAPAVGFGLPEQLPLPQAGLAHGLAHFPATLPSGPPHHVPVASPPGAGAGPSAFVPSPGGQQHKEYMRLKRRVPASQRKRTSVSCDACKVRRCKCIRLGAAVGSDDESSLPPCKLCTDSGMACVTTMPRKQRVYGSVENLDRRYRALEALVAGFFPNLDPRASAEELVAVGRGMGFIMPDFTNAPEQSKDALAGATLTPPSSTTSERVPQPGLGVAYTERKPSTLPSTYSTKDEPMVPQPFPRPPDEEGVDTEDSSSGLISDATGRSHYIGPSGALAFLVDVRKLVSRTLAFRGGSQATQWQDQGDRSGTASIITEKLTGSLGGTVNHPGTNQVSPSQARRLSSTGTHQVDGNEPTHARHEPGARSPDDPNYWQYHRQASMIDLPPREEANACIEAYFQCVHPNFILIHRSAFERVYQALRRSWEASRQDGQGQEPKEETVVTTGWLLCLYMIFIFGSRSLPQAPTSLEFQRKWHKEVEKLPSLVYPASLPTVCGYMLLSLYYHHINDMMSAWMYNGAACRFALSMGMHRQNVSYAFDPLEQYLRKRVWWKLYSYEQFLCCSLGRPSCIDYKEMDVGFPDDDFLEGNILPPRYIEHAAGLYLLIAAIRRDIFDPANVPYRMYREAVTFLHALKGWHDNLPRRLKPVSAEEGLDGNEQPWRRVYLLHIRYHHTLCVLTRPFLLKSIQSAHGGSTLGPDSVLIVALGRICLTGAMRTSELLMEMMRANTINGVTWMDIFYAYLACLNIILALLAPKTLEQDWDLGNSPSSPPPPFPETQHVQRYTIEEMKSAIHGLCRIMANVEVCGTNARFAKASLELAKATGIIEADDPAFKSSPLPNAREMAEQEGTGTENPVPGEDRKGKGIAMQSYDQQQQQPPPPPSQQQQQLYYPGPGGYPVWSPGQGAPMDYLSVPDGDDQSILPAGPITANTGGNAIQWDMVMPLSQWDDGVMDMDMSWGFQNPNPSLAPFPPSYQGPQ